MLAVRIRAFCASTVPAGPRTRKNGYGGRAPRPGPVKALAVGNDEAQIVIGFRA